MDIPSMIVLAFFAGYVVLMVVLHPKCAKCKSRLTYTSYGETTDDHSGYPRTFTPFKRSCFKCKHIEQGYDVLPKRTYGKNY